MNDTVINFVDCLNILPVKDVLQVFTKEEKPTFDNYLVIKNEIKPIDLYCYLYARFGKPNGLQNLLRSNSSDNLIHWDWFLSSGQNFMIIQGLNFRTDVFISGVMDFNQEDLTAKIKSDFKTHGKNMGTVRKSLEEWVEFVNPYQRLKRSIGSLIKELEELNLEPDSDAVPDAWEMSDMGLRGDLWNNNAEKYSRAIGLCFGVRAMLPVLAESFVNLLLFILMKPELKADERLRENLIRQPIDIRVKSLKNNCLGFKEAINYSLDICGKYHSLVNERNDLLHGNVVLEKLKFNDICFAGRVPVFNKYQSMWERSFGVRSKSVGLEKVNQEVLIVDDFIDYLLSCLDDNVRKNVLLISESFYLGLNKGNSRVGVLFPERVVDFSLPKTPSKMSH